MHIAALLVGVCLTLFSGVSLKLGLKMRGNTRRGLQYHGIEERLPLGMGGVAFFAGHTFGVLIGLLLVVWWWAG
jgi:hypothetical protein